MVLKIKPETVCVLPASIHMALKKIQKLMEGISSAGAMMARVPSVQLREKTATTQAERIRDELKKLGNLSNAEAAALLEEMTNAGFSQEIEESIASDIIKQQGGLIDEGQEKHQND